MPDNKDNATSDDTDSICAVADDDGLDGATGSERVDSVPETSCQRYARICGLPDDGDVPALSESLETMQAHREIEHLVLTERTKGTQEGVRSVKFTHLVHPFSHPKRVRYL